jgi:predicted transcriptional regulator
VIHTNETGAAGSRKSKKYFTAEYNTLKLFEYMVIHKRSGPFSIRQLMKFRGINVQRRDRIHESLDMLMDLGWGMVVQGSSIRYQVTEKGEMVYPDVKGYLEFSEGFRCGKRWPWFSRHLRKDATVLEGDG